MKKGIVIKSTGSRYKVLCEDNTIIDCCIKGKLRERDTKTTNPVAVGDNVVFEVEKNLSGVIANILERKNYILRKASNLSKEFQIIAANIDQAFLIVSMTMPETPLEFIDRFLISAEAYRIPATIIFNKTDLYNDVDTTAVENLISIYSKIGYKCFCTSVKNNIGTAAIREAVKDKITLFSGNSGVGKSSLIKALAPDLNIKTAEISYYHKQGRHITSYPEMYRMPFGGFIIDSPGIKGFGIADMEREEIYHFFPEIFKMSHNCKFNNCLHLEEPGCAVRKAVENGTINLSRYKSYINILCDENRKYR